MKHLRIIPWGLIVHQQRNRPNDSKLKRIKFTRRVLGLTFIRYAKRLNMESLIILVGNNFMGSFFLYNLADTSLSVVFIFKLLLKHALNNDHALYKN